MSYPFEKTPLNKYLIELRELRKNEKHYLKLFYSITDDSPERVDAFKKYSEYSRKIELLKSNCLIKPRKEHTFNNKAEIAVIQYDIENPEPYHYQDCTHENIELRIDTHENNSTHIVEQCRKCGLKFNSRKKSDFPQWKSLPNVDPILGQKERSAYAKWKKDRYSTYRNTIVEGDNIPKDFNFEEFRKNYEAQNPPPFPRICSHEGTIIITHRIYKNGNDAIVKQCTKCGKHISSISKSKVKNIGQLPAFDENKEADLDKIYNAWQEKYSSAMREAKISHDKMVYDDIISGKYSYKINNTFNTYYISNEWQWARNEVLKRDNGFCQACGSLAQCVHHITYERLGRESSYDLISLCDECHTKVHKIQNAYDYQFNLNPSEIKNLCKKSND